MTVVIVTHDPAVARVADRELHLLDGRLVDHLNGKWHVGGYGSAPVQRKKTGVTL